MSLIRIRVVALVAAALVLTPAGAAAQQRHDCWSYCEGRASTTAEYEYDAAYAACHTAGIRDGVEESTLSTYCEGLASATLEWAYVRTWSECVSHWCEV